jgi:predicted outer membrane repeat protein
MSVCINQQCSSSRNFLNTMMLMMVLVFNLIGISIIVTNPSTSLAQQLIGPSRPTSRTAGLGSAMSRPTAECSLLLTGHGPSQTGPKTVQLKCLYPPAAAASLPGGASALPPITVGITSKTSAEPQLTGILGRYYAVMAAQARSFEGVTLVPSSELPCQQIVEAVPLGSIPLFALMYFCGDGYNVRLIQPIVQHVWLDYDTGNNLWDTAVVAFGGSIAADIVEGQFINNNGGSVLITMQNAAVHVHSGSVFSKNFGNPGAGVWARGRSLLTVEKALFDKNNCSDFGGAVAVMENATLIAHAVNFTQNIAKIGGGAVYAQDSAHVAVNNCFFAFNTAAADSAETGAGGGAICLSGFVNATVSNNTQLLGNRAAEGGAILVANAAVLSLNGSVVANNAAEVGAGGGILAQQQSVLQIHHTVISGNIARRGNGGGLSLQGEASLELLSQDSRITANHAGGSGGGVYLQSPVFDAAQIANSTVFNNTAVSLNADVGVIADHLTVMGEKQVKDFVSRPGEDQGLLHIKVRVSGHGGFPSGGALVGALFQAGNGTEADGDLLVSHPQPNPASAGISNTSSLSTTSLPLLAAGSNSAGLPSGTAKVLAYNKSGSNGIVNFSLKFQQPPGTYHLHLFLQDNSLVSVVVPVAVRSCRRGEVSPSPDTCQLCPPGSFALDTTSQRCQQCPWGAFCPGGDVIMSLPGWWHSSPNSPQLHR